MDYAEHKLAIFTFIRLRQHFPVINMYYFSLVSNTNSCIINNHLVDKYNILHWKQNICIVNFLLFTLVI